MDWKPRPKGVGLILGCAILATLVGAGVSRASTITYDIDQTIGHGSVVGTIETDGATGVLGTSDFVGWNLELNGVGATFHITQANSVVLVVGSDVTASAGDLFFNYSGGDNGYLLFQDGLFSGTRYYCDATSVGACYQGATVTPESIFDASAQHVAMSGNQIIGVSAVPEPSTWAMMLIGFAGLGFAAYRRVKARPGALVAA